MHSIIVALNPISPKGLVMLRMECYAHFQLSTPPCNCALLFRLHSVWMSVYPCIRPPAPLPIPNTRSVLYGHYLANFFRSIHLPSQHTFTPLCRFIRLCNLQSIRHLSFQDLRPYQNSAGKCPTCCWGEVMDPIRSDGHNLICTVMRIEMMYSENGDLFS
jgi:hypothetical protein